MASSNGLVKLQKHLEWNLWREYALSGGMSVTFDDERERKEWLWKDPMDEGGFDETQSFFMLKPDIDLFGIPDRTRKQRGWYQIVPPLPQYMLFPPAAANIDPLQATGADLPEELFERILGQFTTLPRSPEYSSESELAQFTKRELGACSRVSRYWTRFCQHRMFLHIALRSREDILQLIEFFKDPKSPVSHYVEQLHIEADGASTPWLHLVPSLYDLMRNMIDEVSVALTGPLPRGRGPIRSLHHALPRAPPSFLAGIYDITLQGIHFRRLEDLANLMWEVRNLGWLQCERVTWDTTKTSALQLQRRVASKPGAHSVKGEFVECSQNWALVWLANTHVLRELPRLPLDHYVWLGTLTDIIERGVKASTLRCHAFVLEQEMDTLIVSFSVPGPFRTPFETGRVVSLHIRVQEPPAGSQPQGAPQQILQITEISLLFEAEQVDAFAGLDWGAFDETASSIPSLHHLSLCFPDDEHMKRFSSVSWTKHLSRLSQAGKLALLPTFG